MALWNTPGEPIPWQRLNQRRPIRARCDTCHVVLHTDHHNSRGLIEGWFEGHSKPPCSVVLLRGELEPEPPAGHWEVKTW